MTRITYYGHSCFYVKSASGSFVIDPFISGNPLAQDVDISSIKPDQIFLTHGHGDHVADVEAIATAHGSTVISNFEVASWFAGKGLETIGINPGGTWKGSYGTAKYVTAVHSSSMPDGSYGGNPGGFVFTLEDICFYHAGDTCLTMDMKLIPLLGHKLDFAILPIGGHFTMDAKEAVHAAKFVETKRVIGCHYDSFPPIKIDHAEAKGHFATEALTLELLGIGESMTV